jgi:phosphoglycolate phosphatase-like HAD superfamily hydrolase
MKEGIQKTISEFEPNETMFVFDFDRFIADTDGSLDVLIRAANDVSEPGEALGDVLSEYDKERMKAGDKRAPFEPTKVLGDKGSLAYERYKQLIAESKEDFFYDDVKEVLDSVHEADLPVTILSFAVDKPFQRAKIEAMLDKLGYRIAYQITPEKVKAIALLGSQDEDGYYHIANHVAKNIIGGGDEKADFLLYDTLSNAIGMRIKRKEGFSSRITLENVEEYDDPKEYVKDMKKAIDILHVGGGHYEEV